MTPGDVSFPLENSSLKAAIRAALGVLFLGACSPGEGDGGKSGPDLPLAPVLGATVQVVPGQGLPPDLPVQEANNNLDVVAHEGRVYLAFRTAPSHFASPDAAIHVVSSTDEET